MGDDSMRHLRQEFLQTLPGNSACRAEPQSQNLWSVSRFVVHFKCSGVCVQHSIEARITAGT